MKEKLKPDLSVYETYQSDPKGYLNRYEVVVCELGQKDTTAQPQEAGDTPPHPGSLPSMEGEE